MKTLFDVAKSFKLAEKMLSSKDFQLYIDKFWKAVHEAM